MAPDVPEFITSIVKKLLQPKPEDRYQTAAEVIVDIDRVLNRK